MIYISCGQRLRLRGKARFRATWRGMFMNVSVHNTNTYGLPSASQHVCVFVVHITHTNTTARVRRAACGWRFPAVHVMGFLPRGQGACFCSGSRSSPRLRFRPPQCGINKRRHRLSSPDTLQPCCARLGAYFGTALKALRRTQCCLRALMSFDVVSVMPN